MRGPILLVCLLVLASGCGKSKKDNKVSEGGGDTRPKLTKESSTLDVAKDFLQSSGYGSDITVVSSEEKPVTLFKKPAKALRLEWRGKGDTEAKTSLLIIQEKGGSPSVVGFEDYDKAKTLEEQAALVIQDLEKKKP